MSGTDLLHLYISEGGRLVFDVSPGFLLLLAGAVLVFLAGLRHWKGRRGRYRVVELEIPLGGIGRVRLQPVLEDVQIAHRIWVELATRKAALPIDPEHDVIVEVYNSWYALFGKVRDLIASIPAHIVRQESSTQALINIATGTLNQGLRPHLTRWQARFRNWYANQADALKSKSPQEVQREYPEYSALMADMQQVNQQLIQYAQQLQKLIRES